MDREYLRPQRAGLTLPELLVTLALLSLIATQAVPMLNGLLSRHRLDQAVAAVRVALGQVRRSALATGRDRRIAIRTGTNWSVGCDCARSMACRPCVSVRHHPHVRLLDQRPASGRVGFDGLRGLATPTTLVFACGRWRRELKVALSGRVRVCDPERGTC